MDQRAYLGNDDAMELAMARYKVAEAEYEGLSDKNRELMMSGGIPTWQARRREERAFEELDSARHALFSAAAVAFPTIH